MGSLPPTWVTWLEFQFPALALPSVVTFGNAQKRQRMVQGGSEPTTCVMPRNPSYLIRLLLASYFLCATPQTPSISTSYSPSALGVSGKALCSPVLVFTQLSECILHTHSADGETEAQRKEGAQDSHLKAAWREAQCHHWLSAPRGLPWLSGQ